LAEDRFFGNSRSAKWYWRRAFEAISEAKSWTVFSLIRVNVIGWVIVISALPFAMRFMVPKMNLSLVGAAILVMGLGTGGVLALSSRPHHYVPMVFFVSTVFCRDLYRLLISPGIHMTYPLHLKPGLTFTSWLLWTACDVVFILGVGLSGILLSNSDEKD